jgi:hypothetical protein
VEQNLSVIGRNVDYKLEEHLYLVFNECGTHQIYKDQQYVTQSGKMLKFRKIKIPRINVNHEKLKQEESSEPIIIF